MKYKYDLHVHSVLSPCTDELMTPNNILNMALLNELDIISVTDHNSLKQLDTILEIAESYDFLVLPGVEIQIEDGHLLAYFEPKDYIEFDKWLEKTIENVPHEYDQTLMDVYDNETENYDNCLSGNINSSLVELLKTIKEYQGVVILAHLDKEMFSLKKIIKEEHLEYIDGIELVSDISKFIMEYPLFKEKRIYKNSDSHIITDIGVNNEYIELEDKSLSCLVKELKNE